MNIYEKLSIVQSQIKVNKSNYNSFGKYNYRSAEDILEAAKPICKANGCVLTLSDDVIALEGRFYIKATATLADTESLETIEVTAFAREEESKKGMDASQVSGSCSSYARKYAMNGLFNLDDAKDADTDAYTFVQKKGTKAEPKKLAGITEEEAKNLYALIKQVDASDPVEERVRKICASYSVNSLNELTKDQYTKLVGQLS